MNTDKNSQIATIAKDFNKRLKIIRQERQFSQQQVADMLGVPKSTYANWEQGRREPGIYDIFNILFTLEIDPAELFSIS